MSMRRKIARERGLQQALATRRADHYFTSTSERNRRELEELESGRAPLRLFMLVLAVFAFGATLTFIARGP